MYSGYRVPNRESVQHDGAVLVCSKAVAAGADVAINQSVGSEEALGVTRRFEPAHDSLALSSRLVCILRTIVQPSVLPMLHAHQYLPFGCPIVGDQHTRHVLAGLEQLPKELAGSSLVAPALHEAIAHAAMLVDCAPQIVQRAIDGEEHRITMPFVTRLCPTLAQRIGRVLAELLTPLADRLIGHDDPALSQKRFHSTIAERETNVEPNRMTDYFGREAMTRRARVRRCFHCVRSHTIIVNRQSKIVNCLTPAPRAAAAGDRPAPAPAWTRQWERGAAARSGHGGP